MVSWYFSARTYTGTTGVPANHPLYSDFCRPSSAICPPSSALRPPSSALRPPSLITRVSSIKDMVYRLA